MGIFDTSKDSIIQNAYKRIFDKKSAKDQHEAFIENVKKVCNEVVASRKIKVFKVDENLKKVEDTKTKFVFDFAEGTDKYLEIIAMSGGVQYTQKLLLVAHGDKIETVLKRIQTFLDEYLSPFGIFKHKDWKTPEPAAEEPEKKEKK